MYYAGYDSIKTDVAVFKTREERDQWVNSEDAAVERISLTYEEAIDIIGNEFDTVLDEIDERITWMLNPLNIIQ